MHARTRAHTRNGRLVCALRLHTPRHTLHADFSPLHTLPLAAITATQHTFYASLPAAWRRLDAYVLIAPRSTVVNAILLRASCRCHAGCAADTPGNGFPTTRGCLSAVTYLLPACRLCLTIICAAAHCVCATAQATPILPCLPRGCGSSDEKHLCARGSLVQILRHRRARRACRTFGLRHTLRA